MKKATLLAVCITALLFSCKDNEPDQPAKPYNYRDDIVGTYRGELKTANYTTGEVTITNPVIFVKAFTGNDVSAPWLNDSTINITGDIDPTRSIFSYKLERDFTFGWGHFTNTDSLIFYHVNSIYKRGYFYKLKKQ
jgi:hypothetical protein